MHELSIALALADAATEQIRIHGASRVRTVHVEIGTLTGVDPVLLREAFPAAATGILSGARLDVVVIAARCRCFDCGEFQVTADGLRCPRCGSPAAEILAGRELHLTGLEID